MSYTACRALAATELRNAAWIRRLIAGLPKGHPYRRGALDAFRDNIATARHLNARARLLEAL